MELKVFWTDTAIEQLEAVFDYYKYKANLDTARKMVSELVERTIQLEGSPKSGQVELLLNHRKKEYRYIVEKQYKIIYWIESNYINIASVFDCRQDPSKIKDL